MYALNRPDSLGGDYYGADARQLETYRAEQALGLYSSPDDFRPDLAPDILQTEYYGADDQFGGWNPFKAIKNAASSVVRTVSRAPGISTALAPTRVALALARGGNVARTLTSEAKRTVADTRRALPVAAGVVSFVPGVGTGVASGLSALSAVSQGKSLREIAEEAAIGAVPGGQLAKSALTAGIKVARGQNVLRTVASEGLSYARTQLPGGELTQRALTTGLNIARGGNVMQEVIRNAPLAKQLVNSPLVKVLPQGAALQFPAVGVPAAAAIAATTAVTEAAESRIPGFAAAAKQVIANTKREADRGNQGSAVALGAIKQALESRMALRRAATVAAQATPIPTPAGYRRALISPTGQIIFQ